MANRSKDKGDRFEREAVAFLEERFPEHLMVPKQVRKRKLGAGRMEDTGDLNLLPDTAIQVRAYAAASLGTALLSAAYDSRDQAKNGLLDEHLGLVPVPNARTGTVKWLAAVPQWPHHPHRSEIALTDVSTGIVLSVPVPVFSQVSAMVAWLRVDAPAKNEIVLPRDLRLAHFCPPNSAKGSAYVAPVEAWIAWYLRSRA